MTSRIDLLDFFLPMQLPVETILPAKILGFMDHIEANGFKAYLAGGAVRDILMGGQPSDLDLLTDAPLSRIKTLFKSHKVAQVGKSFPICLVDGIEITTFRRPQPSDLLSPSLHEDLARRDFTVNSMALRIDFTSQPLRSLLFDPFDGRQDLEHRRIRFTGNPFDRIQEDPLRIVRACRFLCKLDGQFEPETFAALKQQVPSVIPSAAPERIRGEIMKAMAYPFPSQFFRALSTIGLLKEILPSLNACVDLDGGIYHQETVFEHAMIVGDVLPAKKPILRLTGYLHDCGKPIAAALKNGRLTFHGHEKQTAPLRKDLAALRFPVDQQTTLLNLIDLHMLPIDKDSTPKSVRRLIHRLRQNNTAISDFLRLRIADRKGNLAKPNYTFGEIRTRLHKIVKAHKDSAHPAFAIADLNVTGHDIKTVLGIDAGPLVGAILGHLLDHVLDDPSQNTPQRLTPLIRHYYNQIKKEDFTSHENPSH